MKSHLYNPISGKHIQEGSKTHRRLLVQGVLTTENELFAPIAEETLTEEYRSKFKERHPEYCLVKGQGALSGFVFPRKKHRTNFQLLREFSRFAGLEPDMVEVFIRKQDRNKFRIAVV